MSVPAETRPWIPWLLTIVGTIWTTGNVLLVVVAMLAFGWWRANPTLASREAVGAIFGVALGVWSTVVCALLLPAAIALGVLASRAWRGGRRGLAIVWLAALVTLGAVHGVNHCLVHVVNGLSAEIRDLRAAGDQPDVLHARDVRFATLHRASEVGHAVETLLALGLAVGGSVALLRRREASVPPATA